MPLMLKPGCGVNRDRAATAQLGLKACLWKCVFFGVFKHFLFGASQKSRICRDFQAQCLQNTGRRGILATHCSSSSKRKLVNAVLFICLLLLLLSRVSGPYTILRHSFCALCLLCQSSQGGPEVGTFVTAKLETKNVVKDLGVELPVHNLRMQTVWNILFQASPAPVNALFCAEQPNVIKPPPPLPPVQTLKTCKNHAVTPDAAS